MKHPGLSRFPRATSWASAVVEKLLESYERPAPASFVEYSGAPSDETLLHFMQWLKDRPEFQSVISIQNGAPIFPYSTGDVALIYWGTTYRKQIAQLFLYTITSREDAER